MILIRQNVTLQKLIIGLVLLVGFTALYTYTRTQVHTFDALSYTQDVENKPFGELYHPHHLLYGAVGRITFDTAKTLGYNGRADQPIQFLNAVAGAIGVILMWRFGGSFTGRRWLPLSVAILMGVCYAYWLYATEVEVYTFAVGFIIAALYTLTLLERQPTPRNAVFIGLTHTGAVMFHQTNILFALPVGLFFLVDSSRRKLLPLYGLTLGVAVGVPYLLVGWFSGFRDVNAFYEWLTEYAQTGTWGGYLSWDHREALKTGLLNTISLDGTLATIFYLLALVGFALGMRQMGRGWLMLCGSWLLLYGGFFWWWEPWNIEFWIALLPLSGVLILTGFLPHPPITNPLPKSLPRTQGKDFFYMLSSRDSPIACLSLAALILAVLLFNQHLDPLREAADSQNDTYQQLTFGLQAHLADTDLVITRGNILDLYLPFYAEHPASNVLSLRNTSRDNLMGRLDHAYRRGQIIYIDNILLDEPREGQRNPFGFSTEDIAMIKQVYPVEQSVVDGFYNIGERSVPNAISWTFENQLHGWLEFGTNNPRFEPEGWCISGGNDPWLESPPLTLDADRYTSVKISLDVEGEPQGEGQLFWRHADEGLDESRSRRFALESGQQTYTLDLSQENSWSGEIVFLRLDPLPENVTLDACIDGLEFQE